MVQHGKQVRGGTSSLDVVRIRLNVMKATALVSRERFCIVSYIDWLVSDLSEEPGKKIT